jgi:hypothetical protein
MDEGIELIYKRRRRKKWEEDGEVSKVQERDGQE